MKRNLLNLQIIALLVSVLFLYSCSNISSPSVEKDTRSGNESFDIHSDQPSFSKSVGIFPSMISQDKGYYFIRGYTGRKFLYFTDKRSMETIALCNKPNCLHTDDKIESCNAYLNNDNTMDIGDILFYDKHIYYYKQREGNNSQTEFYLTQVTTDGTQRKDVYTFKVCPQYVIIHRGYLFFSTTDNGTVNGKEESTISKSQIFRVPMTDLSRAPELIYENNGIFASITSLKGYQDNVFFEYYLYTDSKMEKLSSSLVSYHISTGKVSVIGDSVRRSAICGDKIVYSIDDNHICISNIDGSNKEIHDGMIGDANSDDQYIITDTITRFYEGKKDNSGSPIKMCLYVYDLDGKLIQSFRLDQFSWAWLMGSDRTYIFLATPNPSNENEVIHWKIDKSQLPFGTAELEQYYKYTN